MNAPAPEFVSTGTFSDRVRALLRPRGGSRPWPKRQLDRRVLLFALARRIAPGEELPEREVNARIQDWLLGPGAALRVDHVTLRRALIDDGFWDREAGGLRYRLSRRHERRVRFEDALPGEEEILAASPEPPARHPSGATGSAP